MKFERHLKVKPRTKVIFSKILVTKNRTATNSLLSFSLMGRNRCDSSELKLELLSCPSRMLVLKQWRQSDAQSDGVQDVKGIKPWEGKDLWLSSPGLCPLPASTPACPLSSQCLLYFSGSQWLGGTGEMLNQVQVLEEDYIGKSWGSFYVFHNYSLCIL